MTVPVAAPNGAGDSVPPSSDRGRIPGKLTLVMVALASIILTALVVFLIMRPSTLIAAEPTVAPTHTETVYVTVSPTPAPSTTPSAPEVKATAGASPTVESEKPEPPPAEVAGWISVDVTLYTPADALALRAAPAGFGEFVASYVGQKDDWGCVPEVTVYATHSDGFVYGAEGAEGCGGAVYIWGDVQGWGVINSTQDMFACEELQTAGLPRDVGGLECYDGDDIYYF